MEVQSALIRMFAKSSPGHHDRRPFYMVLNRLQRKAIVLIVRSTLKLDSEEQVCFFFF